MAVTGWAKIKCFLSEINPEHPTESPVLEI